VKKVMTEAPEPPYGGGLTYVTVRDVWEEGKAALGVWVVLSLLFGLSGAAMEYFFGEVTVSLPHLPQSLWFFIALAAGSWFYRGCTIPNLSFRAWLMVMSGSGLFFLLLEYAPAWAAPPLYVAFLVGNGTLDALARKGRENRERLRRDEAQPVDDSGVPPSRAALRSELPPWT
jgi:hypothetical protein